MSDSEFTELLEEAGRQGAYLPSLPESRQEEVVKLLNSCVFGHANAHDLFSLTLVMLNVRPGCVVSVKVPAISEQYAHKLSEKHEALATCDLVGQFFDAYDIPHTLSTNHSAGWPGRSAEVYLNYHVSFDKGHLEQYEAERLDDPYTDDGMAPAEDRALGRFLGYPEQAVKAYIEEDHTTDERLFDSISDAAMEEALGVYSKAYDALALEYRPFTKYLLPYVVPGSASECLNRAASDAGKHLMWGLVVSDEYGITLLDQVISDYCDHHR